jgi:Icc protein
LKFIHLTDPHLVPGSALLYGRSPQSALREAVAHINAHHTDAAFVAITGDLAQAGAIDAYKDFRTIVGELAVPYHLALGNHDRRAAFAEIFPELFRLEQGYFQHAVRSDAALCVFLDTLNEGTSAGVYCDTRLAWLRSVLDAHRDDNVIVFMHHPPLDTGIGSMDRRGLAGRDALYECFASHGRIRHIFFGHVHRPIHGTWKGIGYSCQRSTSHQVDLIFEAADETQASLEPPAYSVVLVDDEQLRVHFCDYTDRSPRFDLRAEALINARSLEHLRSIADDARADVCRAG